MVDQLDFPILPDVDDITDFVAAFDESQFVDAFKDAKFTMQALLAYMSTSQGIHATISSSYSHDFSTPFQFDDDSLSFLYFDNSVIFEFDKSNYKITPKEPGIYAVSVSVDITNILDGAHVMPNIRVNNVVVSDGHKQKQRITNDPYVMSANSMLYLSGDDYVTVTASASQNPVTVGNSEDTTYLQIVKVGE